LAERELAQRVSLVVEVGLATLPIPAAAVEAQVV
jgi:hypothetical protein